MGLCKCPKRQVTNQFCFEHRVNVCEHCMVKTHPKCIVQSYLQWLKDSDYDSSCTLCGTSLQDNGEEDDCVRLICYHVFHWSCLHHREASKPANTAPTGRKCPICSEPIFPPPNLVSPVADALRNRISQVNWGRSELGLPLLPDEKIIFKPKEIAAPSNIYSENVAQSRSSFMLGSEQIARPESPHSVVNIETDYGSSRRPLLAREPPIGSADHDDNKYKRRTPKEVVTRWTRRFFVPSARPFYRRTWFYLIFGAFIFFFIIYVMNYFGRGASRLNPMLDIEQNPNLLHED